MARGEIGRREEACFEGALMAFSRECDLPGIKTISIWDRKNDFQTGERKKEKNKKKKNSLVNS